MLSFQYRMSWFVSITRIDMRLPFVPVFVIDIVARPCSPVHSATVSVTSVCTGVPLGLRPDTV